jgi:hypothetical protein
MMNDILRGFLHKFVIVNLDDVCVFNRTLDEHLEQLRLVLQLFREYSLKLCLKKRFFGLQEMEYLGYTISEGKYLFQQRKSKPLHTGHFLRRKRRFAVSCNSATCTPDLSIISMTLRHLSRTFCGLFGWAVATDDSTMRIATIMMQDQGGEFQPISYFAHKQIRIQLSVATPTLRTI